MKPLTDTDTLPTPAETDAVENPVAGIDQSVGDFTYDVKYDYDARTGLTENTVRYISSVKKEAPWLLDFRLKALKTMFEKPLPTHWASKDLKNAQLDTTRLYPAQSQHRKPPCD